MRVILSRRTYRHLITLGLVAYGVGLAGVVGVERFDLGSDMAHSPADPGEAGKEIRQ